jgi:hypothetical protein
MNYAMGFQPATQYGVGGASSLVSSDEYKSPDPYKAPIYDENKIRSLTQEQAAPSIRGLRSSMQRIAGSSSDNPNAKRMTLREALAGYGQGLQSAISGASASARNAYNQEYGIKANEGLINYNESVSSSRMNFENKQKEEAARYQAELAKYMASTYGNKGYTSGYGGGGKSNPATPFITSKSSEQDFTNTGYYDNPNAPAPSTTYNDYAAESSAYSDLYPVDYSLVE